MNPGPSTRRCAAIGCDRTIEPRYVFCCHHRSRLPAPVRRELRDSVRPGTEGGRVVTLRWLEAAASAIELLAEMDGRPTANRMREVLDARRARAPAPRPPEPAPAGAV